jgi:hypothetical protein
MPVLLIEWVAITTSITVGEDQPHNQQATDPVYVAHCAMNVKSCVAQNAENALYRNDDKLCVHELQDTWFVGCDDDDWSDVFNSTTNPVLDVVSVDVEESVSLVATAGNTDVVIGKVEGPKDGGSHHSHNPDGGSQPCVGSSVQLSELNYVNIMIDGADKSCCRALSDSGAMLPVIRKAATAGISGQSIGQVKIQGIFDDGVVAQLVPLNIRLCRSGETVTDVASMMPIVFAVTESLNIDCDAILPYSVVQELQSVGGVVGCVAATAGEPPDVTADGRV